MMMRLGDILGRIFFILSQKSIIGSSGFIHGAHGGHGSSEFYPRSTRSTRKFLSTEDRIFLVATLEIFGGNLCLDVADARNYSSTITSNH